MEHNIKDDWASLTPEEKKQALYEKQKKLLDDFLERNAISKAQYDKSLHDMTEKMGYSNNQKNNNLKESRKKNLKFNMLLDYCIGKAAASVKETYSAACFKII